jgi:hypothetical protein
MVRITIDLGEVLLDQLKDLGSPGRRGHLDICIGSGSELFDAGRRRQFEYSQGPFKSHGYIETAAIWARKTIHKFVRNPGLLTYSFVVETSRWHMLPCWLPLS